ncbi:MAG: hypothetical protein ACP5HU_05995 [Phycisphaerae bacterium]
MSVSIDRKPEEVRDGVLKHCESLRVTEPDAPYGMYRFSPHCKPTYWASAFVALTRYLFGDMNNLSDEQRSQWLQYLIDGQDEQTGLYIDPVFKSEERISEQHTDELLFWHSTTFILTAVDILGGRPKYPIPKVHDILTPEKMEQMLENLPWSVTPWVAGNWTYDIGCLVGHDYRATGNAANLEAMDAFFNWHEQRQNPETGWWDLVGGFPLTHQQYGGYHTLMVYWMYDREVPRPEAMIDSSLSLQTDEGHFGGGCCPDMDCIDAAVSLARQYDTRMKEVTASMEKALPWLLKQQLPGGGFIDTPEGRDEFGWQQCKCEPGEADPCSDFFRGFSVALCAEVVEGTGLENLPWRHHGSYGHGVRPRKLLA